MLSLGIDGGASSAKWVVIDQSQTVIARGMSAAIDGHLYRPESLNRFNDCLSEIKQSIGDSKIGAVTIGITGYGSAQAIHNRISHFYPGANIASSTDIALAYRGEFDLGEGIFLYAGTGSIAIHITRDEKEITSGGWGYLLGDEGGGFWIGREALRHLARNATSILVTHDVEETFEIADYVYFIANGKIGAQGTPDELNRSVDPFVRQFLDASPEGPVPFNYPGPDLATDFGLRQQ